MTRSSCVQEDVNAVCFVTSLPYLYLSNSFLQHFSDALSVEEMGFLGRKNTVDRSGAAEQSILFRLRNREILGQPEISISSVKHLIPATSLIQANLTNELRPASGIKDVSGLLSIAVLDSILRSRSIRATFKQS